MIKQILIILVALVGFSLLVLTPTETVSAQSQLFNECDRFNASDPNAPEVCRVADDASTTNDAGLFGPDSLVSRVTETIIFITASISVLMIVVGGLRYVLSNGDPQGIGSAKNTILYAVIGLVVALVAEAVLRLVLQRL